MPRTSQSEKLVLRTCICCRLVDKKENLVRLAMLSNQQIVIDDEHKLEGRGAYVCNSICLEKALKENQLNKAFRQKVKTDLLIQQLAKLR